jgi:uncharacterized protein
MLTNALLRAVSYSARQPLRVLLASVLLVISAASYAFTHFDMSTDTGALISDQTEWRRNDAAITAAFPQTTDSIVVVIDGKTPELAEDAAIRLSAAMAEDKKNFVMVRRPDGGVYFDQQGLLFGSLEDVREATEKLIDAQPLLGGLAYDPSLRGIGRSLATAAGGAADTPGDPAINQLEQPLTGLHKAISAKLAGRPAYFSWQQMFSSGKGDLTPPLRRILLVQPELDFSDLQPGDRAVGAVRDLAAKLQIDTAHGVSLGITGEVPLADEEFGSIKDGMGLIGGLMAAAMLLTLWFATKSAKTVLAITVTIIAGLIVTLGIGLLAAGSLNLISVAFIPLFVGLGVDFGIQVSVRFNSERWNGAGVIEALEKAAAAIGAPILLAAGAIVLALGAFLPTDYIGIAELGVISGFGMIVALVLNVTLLPALLVLLKPPVPAQRVGFAEAAPLDRWLERNRKSVLWAFVIAMIASIATLPWVKFDFNPLHLRDPDAPAMRMLDNLIRDPMRTPNTLTVLAPNLDAAKAIATKLSKLPEVRDALTLDSMVPQGQPKKLALIQDAGLLLDSTINPFDITSEGGFTDASADPATVAELERAAAELRRLSSVSASATGKAAALLAEDFDQLAKASPEMRQQVEPVLVQPLIVTLDKLRLSLQASEVTRETMPPEMSAEWVAKDGKALVQVFPSGNSLDNAVLQRFAAAVRQVAPNATGLPVATQEAAKTVTIAFLQAGALALVMVSLLLFAVLRSLREVAYTLAPVVLSGFLTLGSCVLIDQPLNFANIIAFPLLFGVGVAFHIYFVMAWWRGEGHLLQTSLARAVLFSALATGSAFGALWLSDHPGTASMGLILMISLVWTLICALIFEPALLGPVEKREG